MKVTVVTVLKAAAAAAPVAAHTAVAMGGDDTCHCPKDLFTPLPAVPLASSSCCAALSNSCVGGNAAFGVMLATRMVIPTSNSYPATSYYSACNTEYALPPVCFVPLYAPTISHLLAVPAREKWTQL